MTREWLEYAACVHHDPELWSSTIPDEIAWAKEICAACPSKAPCLAWAYETGSDEIAGGTTAAERQSKLRRDGRPTIREHGTARGYHQHHRNREKACQPCYDAGADYRAAAAQRAIETRRQQSAS